MLNDITTYGLLLFYFALYFLSVYTAAKNNSWKLKDVLSGQGDAGKLLINLIAGIFFLGIGAAVLFEKRRMDSEIISFSWMDTGFVWILTAIAAIVGVLSAFKRFDPNNSIHSLPLHLPLSFIPIRTLFIVIYEFFFRAVMLFIMIEDMGIVLAVFINLVFYVIVHWFDKKERYGSVIMGVVLCGITIYSHSIWPAIFIHISLALSHEGLLFIRYKSQIKKSQL